MNNIYFAGQIIPTDLLNRNFDTLKKYCDNAANVFYNALLRGFTENGCTVTAVAGVSNAEDGVECENCGFDCELKYFGSGKKKYFSQFFYTYGKMKRWKKSLNGDGVMLFNCLRITQCITGLIFCALHKVKKYAVVTDVPGYRVINRNDMSLVDKLVDRLGIFLLSKYDGYILLSEEMADIMNIKNKPYTVVEGVCANDTDETKYKKDDCFSVMYAGSLMHKYNIDSLINAVIDLEDKNVVLKLFGNGEMADEIIEISKTHNCIKYYGTVSNSRVLEEEKKSWLLVNPRSTKEEYTKYSFPSKNIEYMRSGTPVLYTKLKSMPEEYYEYINLIEDESADGIKSAIEQIADGDYSLYEEKANAARKFVLENKSSAVQAKKILKMITEEI